MYVLLLHCAFVKITLLAFHKLPLRGSNFVPAFNLLIDKLWRVPQLWNLMKLILSGKAWNPCSYQKTYQRYGYPGLSSGGATDRSRRAEPIFGKTSWLVKGLEISLERKTDRRRISCPRRGWTLWFWNQDTWKVPKSVWSGLPSRCLHNKGNTGKLCCTVFPVLFIIQ